MIDAKKITANDVLKILETVTDPEIPVLSIVDLGIIRKIEIYDAVEKPPSPQDAAQGGVRVFITPTYSGCPAMDVIQINIRMALLEHGFNNVEIKTVLSPPWTTEWMSEAGKQKLKAYGIAPPNVMQQVCTPGAFQKEEAVQCPHCNSFRTEIVSRFGSTPCKALYQCRDCKEPFDYFKCH
jgi:ring-1,2-phenylacetyl-CoA epoxidase subunit PaaD